jgi:type I restriction enzyme M protein
MSSEANRIVQKLWSYCTVLRDDGLSYGDYLEQLSVLLFLKLAHEQTQPPWNQESPVPEGYDWSTLVGKDGAALESQYRLILEHLGKQHGLLGLVFRKAQNKIQDPAKLKRLVSDLLDKEQWMILASPPGVRRTPRAAGAATNWKSCWPATRAAWICSG